MVKANRLAREIERARGALDAKLERGLSGLTWMPMSVVILNK